MRSSILRARTRNFCSSAKETGKNKSEVYPKSWTAKRRGIFAEMHIGIQTRMRPKAQRRHRLRSARELPGRPQILLAPGRDTGGGLRPARGGWARSPKGRPTKTPKKKKPDLGPTEREELRSLGIKAKTKWMPPRNTGRHPSGLDDRMS